MEKKFKGKAIYQPKSKAAEYGTWACNFYVGCSNDCSYCYCKKGVLAITMGQNKPQLKKCFRDEVHAMEIFRKDINQNLTELQKHGLFFSFTTDPILPETMSLTYQAIDFANSKNVPVKVLTKRADMALWGFAGTGLIARGMQRNSKLIAIGFTLTGHDDLEPGASTNTERIEAMRKLYEAGFKTFASIEPIIDIDSSADMILQTNDFCDLYKVGLLSGKKYAWQDLRGLMLMCHSLPNKFYFKDEFLRQACTFRENLPENCVGRDYNIFNQK